MTASPSRRGSSLRLFISIVGSQIAGLAVAIFLVTGPLAGGSEATITGSVLLAFGLGWGLLALSSRFTDQPQRWALVPTAFMGLVGLGLIVAQPSTDVIGILSWIWPAALVAVVVFMVVNARASVHSRARRWVLYPIFAVLVLMAIGGTAEAIMELGDRAAYPTTGQLVDVGDHGLWITCTGTGSPTVVLESGLGESSFYWARISATVSATTKVCVYDRAGRGRSEAALSPQDGLAVAVDLHTLLAQSGNPGPYVLVAHSSGGNYVRIFAATFPDEVAGMVLLDAQPGDALTALPDFPAFYDSTPTLYGVLPSVARLGVLRLAYGSAYADLPAAARDAERADQASVRLQVSARDEMAELRASLQESLGLTTLGDRPLVVVTAGRDAPRGWLPAQDTMATLSTNSSHRVLPDMEHTALITSESGAAASSKAILDVVAAVRTGAPVAN